MDLKLVGRVALITGGASGIGASIAEALGREGAIPYVGDIDEEAASSRARELIEAGYTARAIAVDVADQDIVESAVQKIVARESRLDILVNSAGLLRTGSLSSSRLQDWDALARVNVGGIYACGKAVLSVMVPQHYGKILNLASISALKGGGLIGNTLYGASKAAVVALTQGFAREYGPLGINVNAMAPGLTQTPMIASLDEASRERILGAIPVRRLAEPAEIANLGVFLVSDLASYINGSTVVIDGGALTL